ncbi:hypothetical protein WME91_50065 [Sorangium sp. So ce269]
MEVDVERSTATRQLDPDTPKNANTQAWERPRLGGILDQLKTHLDGSPALAI